MSSWEELYVDREIDDAWRNFRRQVTAALEEPDEADWMFIPESVAADRRYARLIRDDVWFMVSGPATDPVEFGRDDIDRAVAHLVGILRGEFDVMHPSFLLWVAGLDTDEEHRLDAGWRSAHVPAPEPLTGVRSEVWSSLDPRMLIENVDAALSDLLDHTPHKADDGEIFVEGRRGGMCAISVRNFDIEVWTALAMGVDEEASRAGALEMLPKLTEEHPRYRFVLTEGMLIASTVVDGVTFVPDQLRRTMEATLQLHRDHDGLTDFLIELAHRQPGCQPDDNSVEGPGAQETLF